MALTKKVMVLFDPEQYHRLGKEAGRRGCSVGALTREAVDKEIPKLKPKEKKLEATNRLVSAEEEIPDWKERGILIAQGYLNELLFIDTTLMYGRGKEHPYKASCTRIILEIATGSFQENLRLTDTEVLQEIL
ncbi:hypothetical protein M1O51_05175 [Dehalococcoidia bacterium]|nr:hypothetical protein [Dehalococcoidia bacterium]